MPSGSRRSTIAASTHSMLSSRARGLRIEAQHVVAAIDRQRRQNRLAADQGAAFHGDVLHGHARGLRPGQRHVAQARDGRRGEAPAVITGEAGTGGQRHYAQTDRQPAQHRRHGALVRPARGGRPARAFARRDQLAAGGPLAGPNVDVVHCRHSACSTIHDTRSGKLMPMCLACSGTSDSGVMPGWVFISSR